MWLAPSWAVWPAIVVHGYLLLSVIQFSKIEHIIPCAGNSQHTQHQGTAQTVSLGNMNTDIWYFGVFKYHPHLSRVVLLCNKVSLTR